MIPNTFYYPRGSTGGSNGRYERLCSTDCSGWAFRIRPRFLGFSILVGARVWARYSESVTAEGFWTWAALSEYWPHFKGTLGLESPVCAGRTQVRVVEMLHGLPYLTSLWHWPLAAPLANRPSIAEPGVK